MSQSERRILVVEDSPDDAELTLFALEKAGITCPIDVVTDGEAALAYLFDRVDVPLPLFLLVDIHLPKVTGLEVLERVRAEARTRHLPTVMFSSSGVDEDIERAYELGANSYVKKPVAFREYTDAVALLGKYWAELNAPRGTG